MVLFEKLEVDAWSTRYISFQLGFGNEVYEIFISIEIFRKKHDLIEFIIFITVLSSFFREGELDSDNRLDSFFFTGFIELESTIHIPSISNRDGSLPELFRALRESEWITESSLESIVSVRMEMDERHGESVLKKSIFSSRKRKNSPKFAL